MVPRARVEPQAPVLNYRSILMKRLFLLLTLALAVQAGAAWRSVTQGVDYRRITRDGLDVHVTRVDLTNEELRVVATDESERGLTVSEYAKRTNAIVAINADYFDEKGDPIGLAAGACGVWAEPKPVRKQPVVVVGEQRAAIVAAGTTPDQWVSGAVAGWPMLIDACEKIEKLPGSDFFTFAPHPRTAVALSEDRRTLYLVVADGRREGIPGPTLPELAEFLREELDACEALNLDGGGSTAMWVEDRIVNVPSDGAERKVGNHLAVIAASAWEGCTGRERRSKE
jgi:exopolysaccharide biosynthesis protein